MVATLLATSSVVFKHLMARFKTNDIGCKWHEAALPQKIIPYCAREFIKLWYNIRNAWLCSFTLRLDVSRDLRLVHCCNYSQQMWELLMRTLMHILYRKLGIYWMFQKRNLSKSLDCSLWRDLWAICETEGRYASVADMSKNKFLNIVALQHCVNNIWKIRPWFASFRANCFNSCLMISIQLTHK